MTGLALLWIFPSHEGLAWGPVGHRLVAHVAELNLDPEVRIRIRREFNIKHLASVANWADGVKKSKHPPDVLHYTNIAFGQRTYRQERDCPRKRCVTEKIKEYQRMLADTGQPWIKRWEALKFLVHLVADVHQPMHLGYARDRGGNDIPVIWRGRRSNLHKVWDSGFIALRGGTEWQYARILSRLIPPARKKDWSRGSSEDWTNESRALVLDYGYALEFEGGRRLSSAYIQRGRKIIERQLQRAGMRLAYVLNRIFK
ncbi:MAG: S1/P1 nuclease [Nitrospinaceae bacterium]|nr:S1/P1 nuclease [Nitrospinaceae bacterium]NIU43135.1 S1/P1 nuclease [Nitrospinaceae bacterium]NIU95224.1 hypothetical protein [Nitrospinaceae bacterium]NIW57907.1 hypothetical protein [Nitrospinaceae bacterium]